MTIDAEISDTILTEVRALDQLVRSAGLSLVQQHVQIEAYLSLLSFLKPIFPLPTMGAPAVTPDLALLLATHILEKRPDLVVETGSGVSTVVAGYCLARNGCGRIVSVEHDAKYATETARLIQLHGLQDYIQLVHAPLVKTEVSGESWIWYETSFLKELSPESIRIVLIDGPPGDVHPLSRYPALPLLREFLTDDALILVDDANRADEREIIRRWGREYPSFEISHLSSNEKGMSVLTLGPRSSSR